MEKINPESQKSNWVLTIEQYTLAASQKLNKSLWQGKEPDEQSVAIDKGLEEAFEESGEAKRFDFLWTAVNKELPAKPGENFVIPVWMSSSHFYDGCRIFGDKIYGVHNALGLDVQRYSTADQRLHKEYEVIIKKKQKFRVGKPEKREVMTYDEYTGEDNIITVEYTPLYCIEE